MRYVILAFFSFLNCASVLDQNKIITEYDKFNDVTLVKADKIYLEIENNPYSKRAKEVIATHGCGGQVSNCKDGVYSLTFSCGFPDWSLNTNHQLIFLADGERIEFKNTKYGGNVWQGYSTVGVREYVTCRMQTDTFSILANSTNLEGKLGFLQFTLPYNDRSVWRELCK